MMHDASISKRKEGRKALPSDEKTDLCYPEENASKKAENLQYIRYRKSNFPTSRFLITVEEYVELRSAISGMLHLFAAIKAASYPHRIDREHPRRPGPKCAHEVSDTQFKNAVGVWGERLK
jgi:hypothetical protein